MINGRNIHRYLSYFLSYGLAYMALTGGIWTLMYRWLNYEKSSVKWLITFHQGDIFNNDPTGMYIRAPFCLLLTIGTLILFITGLMQFSIQSLLKNRTVSRRIHQWFAILAGAPLVMLSLTGCCWAIAKYYLKLPKDQIKWLIWLHQGWYESLWSYFPIFISIATLLLAITGLNLLYLENMKWFSQSSSSSSPSLKNKIK